MVLSTFTNILEAFRGEIVRTVGLAFLVSLKSVHSGRINSKIIPERTTFGPD